MERVNDPSHICHKLYLCICVFVNLCICVFEYLFICVFKLSSDPTQLGTMLSSIRFGGVITKINILNIKITKIKITQLKITKMMIMCRCPQCTAEQAGYLVSTDPAAGPEAKVDWWDLDRYQYRYRYRYRL